MIATHTETEESLVIYTRNDSAILMASPYVLGGSEFEGNVVATYRHYKSGKLYGWLGQAMLTSFGEIENLIIYRDEDGKVWARPYGMFYGYVDEDMTVRRFEYLGDEDHDHIWTTPTSEV